MKPSRHSATPSRTPRRMSRRAPRWASRSSRSGQFEDASSYLSGVVKADPQNGPVWMGLAEIALAAGDKKQALRTLPAGALQGLARIRGVPAPQRPVEIRFPAGRCRTSRRSGLPFALDHRAARRRFRRWERGCEPCKGHRHAGTGRGSLRRTGPPLPRGCQCLDEARRHQVRRRPGCARARMLTGMPRRRIPATRMRARRWLASKKFFAWIPPGKASP